LVHRESCPAHNRLTDDPTLNRSGTKSPESKGVGKRETLSGFCGALWGE